MTAPVAVGAAEVSLTQVEVKVRVELEEEEGEGSGVELERTDETTRLSLDPLTDTNDDLEEGDEVVGVVVAPGGV